MENMKSLITTFLAIFFFSSQLLAQEAARMQGEVLVMTKEGADIHQIVSETNAQIGALPQLKINELVSAPMRTWLLSFNEDHISMREILYALQKANGVKFAQVNHIVADRIVPNDPFYSQQWHHQNNGDHDIDSELAWEVTTGGLTATGDEIVVCVVETGGAKWDQADIVDNHWTNNLEIPNNGIDDDGNGYIDDYDGWNVSGGNDNIGTGNHGTQVSSMIGAKGDNNTGIVGVNWDIKIMQVHMGGISESNVVAAYTYPFTMRKKYNQTGGAEGAFVVATNSSWGTDFGQPADAPIWCAMYDSLGTYGVLSCGATSNSNVNVDAVGDLPTACPSEFMVSVTATDDNDVRTFSGYGQTTIDLGAPGDNVFLAGNNNYGNTSGTSFASPCVAGAIGLLYSVPCTNIMAIAYADPEGGAAMIRDYIFNGVDGVSNLTTETVTGGRLNVNNSIQLMLANCSNDDCFPPFAVNSEVINGTDINITWASTPSMESFSIRYRIDNGEWTETTDILLNETTISGLLPCTTIEFQLNAYCNGAFGDWTDSFFITTAGCCEHPSWVNISNQTESSVTIDWEDLWGEFSYTVVITDALGEQQTFEAPDNSISIENLDECANYNVQVYTICVGNPPPPISYAFSTFGCGSCLDLTYCEVSGNSSLEWIDNVTLETINNTTGSDNGYGDYRNLGTTLVSNQNYEISLTPGYSGTNYPEYFKAWIDFNQNGTFETSEKIYDSNGTTTTTVSGSFTVPNDALEGTAVLRVSMAYVGVFGGNPPTECGDQDYGEAEDYCITISHVQSVPELTAQTLNFYPNPATEILSWSGDFNPTQLQVFNISGQLIEMISSKGLNSYDVSHLAEGLYTIRATNGNGEVFTKQIMIMK